MKQLIKDNLMPGMALTQALVREQTGPFRKMGLGAVAFGLLYGIILHLIDPWGPGMYMAGIMILLGVLIVGFSFVSPRFMNTESRNIQKCIHDNNYILFEATVVSKTKEADSSGDTTLFYTKCLFAHAQTGETFVLTLIADAGIYRVGSSYYILALPRRDGLYVLNRFYLHSDTEGFAGLTEELQRNFRNSVPPLTDVYTAGR